MDRKHKTAQLHKAMIDERGAVRKVLQYWVSGNMDAGGFRVAVDDMVQARKLTDHIIDDILDDAEAALNGGTTHGGS